MKFVFDNDKNLFEAWDKEEVIAAIVNYLETHAVGDVDTGFVTTIKEQNADKGLKFWIGTTAQYNAIETKDADTLYILTDDTELADIEAVANQAYASVMEIAGKKGVVLLDQTVEYNTSLSVALSGANPLEDFSVVKVAFASSGANEILCNVRVNPSTVQITGCGNFSMTSSNGTQIAAANITVDRQENKITRNTSVVTTFIAGATNIIIDEARIYKITGVY